MEQQRKIMWDNTFSTFYWEMEYKEGHKSAWGYSKADGQPEALDKNRVLCRCIKMLLTRGFITDKCHRITVFKKGQTIIRKDKDESILILQPDTYLITSTQIDIDVKNFLNEIYTSIKTGIAPEHKILPNLKVKNRSLDEIYKSAVNVVYTNYDSFFKARLSLKAIGVPEGQLRAMDFKVKLRQPELFSFEGAIQQTQNFMDKKPEKKLTPLVQFYGFTKEQISHAADKVKAKIDILNLPKGELVNLITAELQNANNNMHTSTSSVAENDKQPKTP